MKRIGILLLCLLLLSGCVKADANRYVCDSFEANLPEGFQPVAHTAVLCFAPMGDPVRASCITFYATESNWYFDTFTQAEYEDALQSLCGYDSLSVTDVRDCQVDGYDAKRIACKAELDQGMHDLILYAISAEKTDFFTLLNREGDNYIEAFDAMMDALRLKG